MSRRDTVLTKLLARRARYELDVRHFGAGELRFSESRLAVRLVIRRLNISQAPGGDHPPVKNAGSA